MPGWLTQHHWLWARVAAGALVFSVLALVDFRKNGRQATRWREYVFLLFVTSVGMLYGALNDQITSLISWEYFYYGKELAPELGADVPPDRWAMSWASAKVGMGATWSAGLLVGVALLIANNPRAARPQLTYRALASALRFVLAIVLLCSIIGGTVGYLGGLTRMSSDFGDMVSTNYWRPYRFMCTFGVHLGAYAGGLLGGTIAVVSVVRKRKLSVARPTP